MIQELLQKSGFEVLEEGILCLWQPDEGARAQCRQFGQKLAKVW